MGVLVCKSSDRGPNPLWVCGDHGQALKATGTTFSWVVKGGDMMREPRRWLRGRSLGRRSSGPAELAPGASQAEARAWLSALQPGGAEEGGLSAGGGDHCDDIRL